MSNTASCKEIEEYTVFWTFAMSAIVQAFILCWLTQSYIPDNNTKSTLGRSVNSGCYTVTNFVRLSTICYCLNDTCQHLASSEKFSSSGSSFSSSSSSFISLSAGGLFLRGLGAGVFGRQLGQNQSPEGTFCWRKKPHMYTQY